jgi:hypothetical protein
VRDGAPDMVRRYIDFLLIFTMCDTDQARVVGIVWQALAIANERVDQRAERRRDRPLVRHTMEGRELTASGAGAAFRHVGRLVPVQHVTGRIQIADLS